MNMPKPPEISAEDAKKRLEQKDAVFMDVRDPQSYSAAHIPRAVHVNDSDIEGFLAKSDKKRTVIVYCYHGNTSLGGAAYLLDNGFEDVYSLSGGFEGWRDAFPAKVETEAG